MLVFERVACSAVDVIVADDGIIKVEREVRNAGTGRREEGV